MDAEVEPRRHIFRLRDLVVVCLIVGSLMAMAIPAVLGAREAARRSQCSCKLKQLGLALQNHHDVFKHFPALTRQGNPDGSANVWATAPGATLRTNSPPPNGYQQLPASAAGYSWIVMILPYLEEQRLYDMIAEASEKFTYEAFSSGTRFYFCVSQPPQHFSTDLLDEVVCPSYEGVPYSTAGQDGADPKRAIPAYQRLSGSYSVVGTTHYVALSATHLACMATDPSLMQSDDPNVEPPNGVIVPGEGLKMNQILDGTSKTLIVCETREPAVNSWYDGTVCWTVGANPSASHQPTRDPNATTSTGKSNSEGYWIVPQGTTNALGLNFGPDPDPKRLFAPNGRTAAQTQIVSWGPSSYHTGSVVMHLAADGSVHSITSDIDPTLYIHLITRAGERVIEPDHYR